MIYQDKVAPWVDLEPALGRVYAVYPEITDVELWLMPWGYTYDYDTACDYVHTHKLIRARVWGLCVEDGCLMHELAHRWQYLDFDPVVFEENPHDELFYAREEHLKGLIGYCVD